ncbi:histidine kinase [Flexivirga oryzae]|uniref:Signal transduction histidine kinase n=1 Tax=Flexivirga oryzae TaxID=1794944 RepID=A0A839NAB7_9MICO|nr:histidine kinase [Flexivirga oryzae]MBB2893769.1 signal transduction histidine kinase [Flexivirga oryzae]
MPEVDRPAVRIAFVIYLSGLLVWLALGLVPMRVAHPDMSHMALDSTTPLQTGVEYFFSVLNLALGVLLFLRRPDERVPRLLTFALLGTAATFNLPSHRAFHLTGSPWPIAVIHFTFHIVSGVAYVWAVVLFPDGTLPRRIRLSARLIRVVVVLSTAVVAVVCWRSSFLDHPQFFLVFFGIAVALIGVGAQAMRIVDPENSPAERAPARLLCAALLPALAVALLWLGARTTAALTGHAHQAAGIQHAVERLFPAVFAIVPVVLFAGVVRYRLWDIDRLLSRVLVYGLLALTFSAVYVLAVAVGGHLTHGGVWVTAVALSIAAVLLEPLRTAARTWANRVVFGQVLSPAEATRSLAEALEHLTPATELEHLVAVTVAATRADSAELWLLDEDRLLPVAATRASAHEIAVPTGEPAADALAALVGAHRGWPVRHQGIMLGLLAVRTRHGERLAAADDTVGQEIAAHAGLLVHNATLTTSLAHQVDALDARARALAESRRRLVAAQDAERHTLERALHDGAQQALVAAIIGARAGTGAATSPHPERDALREVLRTAQHDIRELSGDGRPGALRRLGLAGALQRSARLAGRTGIDVELQVDLGSLEDPLPAEVETAVYFACVEGLQNVVKYAAARRVLVSVGPGTDGLSFAVVDDGLGAPPGAASGAAGGLPALAARFAALGGDVAIVPGARGGTELHGRVPLRRTTGAAT